MWAVWVVGARGAHPQGYCRLACVWCCMQLSYVDLYLIHWPSSAPGPTITPPLPDVWRALEALVDQVRCARWWGVQGQLQGGGVWRALEVRWRTRSGEHAWAGRPGGQETGRQRASSATPPQLVDGLKSPHRAAWAQPRPGQHA